MGGGDEFLGLLSLMCPLLLRTEYVAVSAGLGDHDCMSSRQSYRKGPVVLRGTQIPTQTTFLTSISSLRTLKTNPNYTANLIQDILSSGALRHPGD